MKDTESYSKEKDIRKLLYDIVCRPHCRFYKEGQEDDPEESECAAWEVLSKQIMEGTLTVDELLTVSESAKKQIDPITERKQPLTLIDKLLLDTICRSLCEFYRESQEHRDKEYQCGAYKLIKTLISSRKLTFEDVKAAGAHL